ncbi:MAG: hypothetical protein Q9226_007149 [Calogaya cf. arnoldii]
MVAPALSMIEGGRREEGCLHPAATSANLSSQSPEHRTVTYEPRLAAFTATTFYNVSQGLGAVLTLFNFVSTSPVDLQPRAGNFIVQQTTPKPFKKSGPAAILSTYGKYNASAPEDVIKAATANDGKVSANPTQFDAEYLSPVTIGEQTLNLDFDSGSSDLYQTNGHSIYNPTLSSTSKALEGYTWGILYGDGSSASGDVGTDTVKVGTTTVTGQAVERADEISSQFELDIESDGVLGLGFDSINGGELFAVVDITSGLPIVVRPVKQKTFFSNAKASLSAPLFTANLKKGKPGCYTFGYVDASEHTGSITYVPANSDTGLWEFTTSGYAVGTAAFRNSSFLAIVDTGTSVALLPDAILRAYYRSVRGASYNFAEGGYTYPCSVKLPSFTIGIGSYKAVIPGSYITYAPTAPDSNTCFGGLQSNGNLRFAILGDIFLKSQFVVFQTSPLQLGFAKKPL